MTIANVLPTVLPNEASADQLISNVAARTPQEGNRNQNNFDQYLTALEKKNDHGKTERNDPRAANRPADKKTKPAKEKTTDTVEKNESQPTAKQKESRDNTTDETSKSSTEATTEPNADSAVATEKVNDNKVTAEAENQIVLAIAGLMNVPVETVMAWLSELNLQPSDLTDPQAVSQLLQTALDIQSPAALLKSTAFQPAFEAVTAAVAEITEQPQTTAAVRPEIFAELEGLQLTADQDGNAVIINAKATEAPEAVTPEQVAAATQATEEASADDIMPELDLKTESPAQTHTVEKTATQAGTANTGGQQQNDSMQAESQLDAEALPLPTVNVMTESATRFSEAVKTAQQAESPQVNATDVMNQIMSRVRMQSGDQFAELKITLRPENLGDVTLRVTTQNGIVTAQFIAENQRVREVLESNFNQLRDTLQQQGVQIQELSVSVRQEDNDAQMNQFRQAQQSGRRRLQRIMNRTTEAAAETTEQATASEVTDGIDFTA